MLVTAFNENLWFAIAEPSRRQLIDILLGKGGVSATSLACDVPYSRQAVSKHLAVLQKAGLVHSWRVGKEVRFEVDPGGIFIASQEMSRTAIQWNERLQKIKLIAEAIHQPNKTA